MNWNIYSNTHFALQNTHKTANETIITKPSQNICFKESISRFYERKKKYEISIISVLSESHFFGGSNNFY